MTDQLDIRTPNGIDLIDTMRQMAKHDKETLARKKIKCRDLSTLKRVRIDSHTIIFIKA